MPELSKKLERFTSILLAEATEETQRTLDALKQKHDAALSAAMTSAWDKQAPIVAYYWEPTWLLGKYDFVLLEDDPYDPETYHEGIGACPAVTVTVAVSNDFAASNPEYCEFLSKFSMPSAIISEALAYMQDNGINDHGEVAKWLLSESHPELVDEWLTPEQAETLRAAL